MYSSLATQQLCFKLDPYWVTGFVDGEGCFTVSISQSSNAAYSKLTHNFSELCKFRMCIGREGTFNYRSLPQSSRYREPQIRNRKREFGR